MSSPFPWKWVVATFLFIIVAFITFEGLLSGKVPVKNYPISGYDLVEF